MDCYQCGKDIGDKLGLCEECQASRHEKKAAEKELRAAPVSQPSSLADRMPYLFAALGVVLVLWLLFGPRDYGSLPEGFALPNASSLSEREVCQQGKECVLVYLAPWCPACKGALPVLPELSTLVEGSGRSFAVIVGSDSEANLKSFAAGISTATFLDLEGRFRSITGGGGVPHVYALDAEGTILNHFSGMISGGSAEQRKDWYSKKLGMEL